MICAMLAVLIDIMVFKSAIVMSNGCTQIGVARIHRKRIAIPHGEIMVTRRTVLCLNYVRYCRVPYKYDENLIRLIF